MKKLIEQTIETQLVHNPIIAVYVDDRLVEVKNHNYSDSHCMKIDRKKKEEEGNSSICSVSD